MTGAKNGNGNAFRRWLGAFALAALSLSSAHARDAVSRSSEAQWLDQMANKATMRNSANGRGSGPNPAGYSASTNGAYASGTKALPWPGKAGANNIAAWKAKARGADLARALMNPGSAAITLVGGMALKQLIDFACVDVFGGTLSDGVAWQECNFVDKQGKEHKLTTEYPPRVHQWIVQKVPECTSLAQFVTTKNNNGVTYVGVIEPANLQPDNTNGGTCVIRNPNFPAGCSGSACLNVFSSAFTSRDVILRVKEGMKPITDALVEPKIAAAYEAQCQSDFTAGLGADSTCPRAFAEVVNAGIPVEVDDAEVDSPVYVEGPCVTSKTTHADGSYTNRTVCDDASYDDIGNTVQRTQVKKETVQEFNADGTAKGPATSTQEETVDTRTECEKNPEGVACKSDTYDIPTGEVPKETKNVTLSIEDMGWGAGSCPAPFSWNDSLGSHSLDLASYCTVLTNIVKPVLLALATLIAIGIAMPGMRIE